MANPANPQFRGYATAADVPPNAGPHVQAHDNRFYPINQSKSWPGFVAIVAIVLAVGIGAALAVAVGSKVDAGNFSATLKRDQGYAALVDWANQADTALKKVPTKKSVDEAIVAALNDYKPEVKAENVAGLDEAVKKSVGDVGKQVEAEVDKQMKTLVASGAACKQQCTVTGSNTPQVRHAPSAQQPKRQAAASTQQPVPAVNVHVSVGSGVPTHCNWASDGSLRLKTDPLKVIARDVSIMTIAKKDLKPGQTCESWKDEQHARLADTTSRDVATLKK